MESPLPYNFLGGETDDAGDDDKAGDAADCILRDFNHEIRCKFMEKDRGLKVAGPFSKPLNYFQMINDDDNNYYYKIN